MSSYGTINPELLGLAKQNLAEAAGAEKSAFVQAGDPMMDPMAGGAPPMDPMAGLQPMIQQAVQAAMGGAGGAGEGQIKPKIDVNIEIMQIKKILAKISDALGIQIPAADMVATPEDLTAMAQGGSAGAGAIEGGGGGSAISPPAPIEPIGAAAPKQAAWENGRADAAVPSHTVVEDFQSTADVASAWLSMQAAADRS